MIKTPPVDQDLLIACSSSSICTRQTTIKEQKRGRKRKDAPSYSLWAGTSPEVHLQFLYRNLLFRFDLMQSAFWTPATFNA